MKVKAERRSIAGALLLAAACALACASAILSWKPPVRAAYTFRARPAEVQPVRVPDAGVRVNTASLAELTQLPGVGEKLAQAIIDERERHGAFFYPEDLLTVTGIGQKKLAGMLDSLSMTEAND